MNYQSLGIYHPPKWKAWKVGKDLTKITRSLDLVPLQDPSHRHQTKAAWCDVDECAYVRRRTVMNPKAASWHQDGDLDGGQMDNWLVLWSSNTPTQLKVGDKIITPKNREIILFHNLSCYHRRPEGVPKVRWLFRQRVKNGL